MYVESGGCKRNETYDENGGRQEEEESMYTQTNKKNVSERPTFYGSNILW